MCYREGAPYTVIERKDGRMGADSRRGSDRLEAPVDGCSVRCERATGTEFTVGFDGHEESHVEFLFAHGLILSAASAIEALYRAVQLPQAQGSETSGDNDGTHFTSLRSLSRKARTHNEEYSDQNRGFLG